MKLAEAQAIANTCKSKLAPYCTVCEIAGSIRREKLEVKDIEIVCIPSLVTVPNGLFDKMEVRHPEFATVVRNLGLLIKGSPDHGKYVQLVLNADTFPDTSIKVDLFIATPENFGYIYMLRTGSSGWNTQIMIPRGKSLGLTFSDGSVWSRGKQPLTIPDEAAMFRYLNMPYVEPYNRRV